MHGLTLRPFTAADFDIWYPLWRGYQAFYRVDIAESISRTTWQRLLDPAEPMHGTFAVQDGNAVTSLNAPAEAAIVSTFWSAPWT